MEKYNIGMGCAETGDYSQAIKILNDVLLNLRASINEDHQYINLVKNNLDAMTKIANE